MEHIIVMVKKENPAEQVVLNGVMYCDYLYGCLVALTTADGARPLFETDVWDMYDLTPRKGGRATTTPSRRALPACWRRSPVRAACLWTS